MCHRSVVMCHRSVVTCHRSVVMCLGTVVMWYRGVLSCKAIASCNPDLLLNSIFLVIITPKIITKCVVL